MSAETRERILRAARPCFAAGGYGQTGNQQIAAAAGVSAPALYHYFSSKAALFAAVHDRSLEILLEAYRAAVGGRRRAVEQLCAIVEANVRLNRDEPGLAEFLAIAPMELRRHPELASLVHNSGEAVPALFHQILEGGVRRGELPETLDLETTVRLLTAASFGLSWFHGQLPAADHDAVLRAFQALLRGELLGSRGAPTPAG